MANPWLSVPLSDYEAHMNAPEVQQLGALSDLFAAAVAFCKPQSIAILGIAGGNGLERIEAGAIQRIVGVDINPEYLAAVRNRYPGLGGLELYCADLARETLAASPVEYVHAALILEHAGTQRCLENAIALTAPAGHLGVVLQLPSETAPAVGASSVASVQKHKAHFSFVKPEWLRESLTPRGFEMVHEMTRPLPAGKAFWAGIFRKQT
jgi:Methyltransferase domain